MKKILVCDDHATIRKGVKQILSDEFSEVEFGEAANAAEAIKKAREKKWDMMILDVDMPGRSGLEVLQDIKNEELKIPVLMFSLHPEEHIAVRALKLGAYGYLAKASADKELMEAVRSILCGKKYITPSLAEQLVSYIENPGNKPSHELLSDREYQTFLLMTKGKNISEIAKELSLSPTTVSTFRHRILEKMGMRNNAELTSYAVRNSLV